MAGRKTWRKSGNWTRGTGAFHQTETQASKNEGSRGNKKETLSLVDLGHAFTKFHLRPNLGATGCSVYGELGSVASLSQKTSAAVQSEGRLDGMMQHGAKYNVRYVCNNDRVNESARKKAFQSFGHDEMMRMFNSPKGQALR